MLKEIQLALNPKEASEKSFYLPLIAKKLKIRPQQITEVVIKNRSIDARNRNVKVHIKADVWIEQTPDYEYFKSNKKYRNVSDKEEVIVIGAGPAGLFAALKLIELGIKPLLIEQGKEVNARKRDVAAIHKNLDVNPLSNYGFGEGGAGTFSDGKLYTRSKKRGDVKNILSIFCEHGAPKDIMIDAHPHIGTNKLPNIISNIRATIIHFGGEVFFEHQFKRLLIENKKVVGIELCTGLKIHSRAVILATGHSAREVYKQLDEQGVRLEAKNFAMGVRIEHPQLLIDQIQYSCQNRGPYLPSAAYNLVYQANKRGVYSFCMCPGGIVVPASTAPDEMVVNGMSPANRNTKFANSGIVVEIHFSDLKNTTKNEVMKGLSFQEKYEKLAFFNGGEGQIAPAQRMVDFVNKKLSTDLPKSSFRPGLHSSPLHEWIPTLINERLREALPYFDKKMKGYFTNDAVLIGVESRTSSPIRIPRNNDNLQHIEIEGLFPCGEGAGYSGGIISSAIDGENCALQVDIALKKQFTAKY